MTVLFDRRRMHRWQRIPVPWGCERTAARPPSRRPAFLFRPPGGCKRIQSAHALESEGTNAEHPRDVRRVVHLIAADSRRIERRNEPSRRGVFEEELVT